MPINMSSSSREKTTDSLPIFLHCLVGFSALRSLLFSSCGRFARRQCTKAGLDWLVNLPIVDRVSVDRGV